MQESLIDRIYEAAGTPELWPDMLQCFGDYATSDGGVLTVLPSIGKPRRIVSPTLECRSRRYSASTHWQNGGRMPQWRAAAHAGFLRDIDLSMASHRGGIPLADEPSWQVGTTIPLSTGDLAIITAERRVDHGPHEAGILEKLDAVRPHLVRACQLSAQFGYERARATTTALERIGLPAAILTASGRALSMNGRLQERAEILPAGQHGGIVFKSLTNGKLLQDAINNILCGHSVAEIMPVRTHSDHRALIAHILRFDRHNEDAFDASAILLILVQVGASTPPDHNILNLLFDLTPAETRLLQALAGGQRLQSYATNVGVRISTVRSQLKSIFTKTGTRRQADLLSVVASVSIFHSQSMRA